MSEIMGRYAMGLIIHAFFLLFSWSEIQHVQGAKCARCTVTDTVAKCPLLLLGSVCYEGYGWPPPKDSDIFMVSVFKCPTDTTVKCSTDTWHRMPSFEIGRGKYVVS